MNKREEILNEALQENDQETERWRKYADEQNVAIENMDTFSKNLEIDVMVPIGSKALMPGKLCHTNEVFVSHYDKIFSKCTVFQAKKICQHRINQANSQLEKLSTERKLFQNKLDIPYTDGVLPKDGEFEIIEEYDEENERLWQEKHKISVRDSKRKKKIENVEVNHTNVMQMLDDLELMDELETELDDLGIENNETLENIISGKIKVVEKERISHLNNNNSSSDETSSICNNLSSLSPGSVKDVYELSNNKHKDNIENCMSNIIGDNNSLDELSDESDNSSTYDIPKEIIAMEEEIEGFSTKEQIKFYKKNIKSVEKDIESMRISNPDELDKKLHKIEIRDYLIDLVSILEDQIEHDNVTDTEIVRDNNKQKKVKRISFALEDEIKYIDKTEKVEDMFKNKDDKKRDIIKLDPIFGLNSTKDELIETSLNTEFNKKKSITEKVEENLNFVKEMQSHEDFDLVGKILKPKSKTLSIRFHHSDQIYENPLNNNTNSNNKKFQLGSPADFYTLFNEKYPQNLNMNMVHNNSSNENRSKEAYTDLRTEVCSLQNQKSKSKTAISSILKNKGPVIHNINLSEPEIKEHVPSNSFDYDMIMGDVIEKEIYEPEPLPEEKFIDTHAPKKRVSRFKQSRTMKTV